MSRSPLPNRVRLAVLGLQSVGKSSFVAALHGKAHDTVPPTEGCNKSSIVRGDLTLDLLDVGGKATIRKFWMQMTTDADGIVVMVNASEADDLSWMLLGQELRSLREGRPVLVLLNRRDASPHVCLPAAEALDRLGLPDGRGVHIERLANSYDLPSSDPGLDWLCDELVRSDGPEPRDGAGELSAPRRPRSDDESDEEAAAAPQLPPPGSGIRALRGLRDARQYVAAEAEHVAELQSRLMAGHILSQAELEMIRAAGR